MPAGGSTILNKFLIAFLDEKQAVIIRRDRMIPVIKLIEKERPDLIKSHKEYNKKGKKNLKYIISLSIDDDYFRMMQPKIFRAK